MFEIMNKEKNVIVGPKQESLSDFFLEFSKDYPSLLSKNVVVNLNSVLINSSSEVLVFLNTAKAHSMNRTSFVIVAHGVKSDSLPEELKVVPTLVEAMDILEMEEISRDLGF
jgi:hypothetical protein